MNQTSPLDGLSPLQQEAVRLRMAETIAGRLGYYNVKMCLQRAINNLPYLPMIWRRDASPVHLLKAYEDAPEDTFFEGGEKYDFVMRLFKALSGTFEDSSVNKRELEVDNIAFFVIRILEDMGKKFSIVDLPPNYIIKFIHSNHKFKIVESIAEDRETYIYLRYQKIWAERPQKIEKDYKVEEHSIEV